VNWTVALAELPPEHPLRNAGLAAIGAEYQWAHTKEPDHWHQVTKSFKIAKNTFNELGPRWTVNYVWRAQEAK
jgi:hypothetical protein